MSPISMPVFAAAAGASVAAAWVVWFVSVMRFRSSRRLYCSARPCEGDAQSSETPQEFALVRDPRHSRNRVPKEALIKCQLPPTVALRAGIFAGGGARATLNQSLSNNHKGRGLRSRYQPQNESHLC